MCKSQSEGGQRCHGHAAAALAAAENQCAAVDQERPSPRSRRWPAWSVKNAEAHFDLEDARARYASTPQGEADLFARMGQRPTDSGPPRWIVLPLAEHQALAQAVSQGRRLRAKAKDINEDVKAGTLTREQARTLAEFPSAANVALRKIEIDQLAARTPRPAKSFLGRLAQGRLRPPDQPSEDPRATYQNFFAVADATTAAERTWRNDRAASKLAPTIPTAELRTIQVEDAANAIGGSAGRFPNELALGFVSAGYRHPGVDSTDSSGQAATVEECLGLQGKDFPHSTPDEDAAILLDAGFEYHRELDHRRGHSANPRLWSKPKATG